MIYEYEIITKKIMPGWTPFFEENKELLQNILKKLNSFEYKIYPKPKDIFRALFYYDPKDIKLLILGQDPYIGEENELPQAMGLSFSVPKNHRLIPPSLKNIFKEIKNCYPDYEIPKHGLLKKWAKREKILLLNSALSVQAGNSNSHALLWQDFTDKLINWFQKQNDKCIFLLMGNNAKSKANLIDSEKHKIFITIHPSPLSAHRGFFGCGVFKEINEYLKLKDLDEINY
jgi:uracil-DNA glycosylase